MRFKWIFFMSLFLWPGQDVIGRMRKPIAPNHLPFIGVSSLPQRPTVEEELNEIALVKNRLKLAQKNKAEAKDVPPPEGSFIGRCCFAEDEKFFEQEEKKRKDAGLNNVDPFAGDSFRFLTEWEMSQVYPQIKKVPFVLDEHLDGSQDIEELFTFREGDEGTPELPLEYDSETKSWHYDGEHSTDSSIHVFTKFDMRFGKTEKGEDFVLTRESTITDFTPRNEMKYRKEKYCLFTKLPAKR